MKKALRTQFEKLRTLLRGGCVVVVDDEQQSEHWWNSLQETVTGRACLRVSNYGGAVLAAKYFEVGNHVETLWYTAYIACKAKGALLFEPHP